MTYSSIVKTSLPIVAPPIGVPNSEGESSRPQGSPKFGAGTVRLPTVRLVEEPTPTPTPTPTSIANAEGLFSSSRVSRWRWW